MDTYNYEWEFTQIISQTKELNQLLNKENYLKWINNSQPIIL